ncbi:MAG: hypothetical protein HN337_09715 [Deltaproteobacteria bacterium]|jgi:hypothetical protein|nr:hypothetical protein [Deltaproteobacteria bacterium]
MKSYDAALSRVQSRTAETGIAHYVKSLCYDAEDLPHEMCDYYVISCPLDKEYDDWFGSNELDAQRCATAWNEYSEVKGSPSSYEAKVSYSRWVLADIWKVFKK